MDSVKSNSTWQNKYDLKSNKINEVLSKTKYFVAMKQSMLLWQWLFIFPTQPCPNVCHRCWSALDLSLNPVFSGNVHSSFCCAVEWSHQQPAKCAILWCLNTQSEIQQRLRLFSADLCYCSVFYSSARASQCSALPIKCEPDKERERGREGSGVGCASQWGSAIVGAVCSFTSDLCYPSKPEDRGGAAVLRCSLRTHG